MIISKRSEVERYLGDPPKTSRAALIYGRDRGGVRERADRLARASTERPEDPFDVGLLSETDIDAEGSRLVDELCAQSLMGGRRLVRLRLTGDKITVDRTCATILKAHAEGVYNPDTFFLIEAGVLGRESVLRKTGERTEGVAIIPCYEDEPGDVVRLVRESLAKDKVGLSADALELFVARLPHERGVARQEIERLALFLGPGSGSNANVDDLRGYLSIEPEASLAEAAENAFGGKLAGAYSGLRRAAAEGESGPAAVRALGQHLAKLRRTLILSQNGVGLAEAAKAAGVFWRNEREFLRQARGWTLEQLDCLQADVIDADRSCKQTGSPDALLAERLALSVAGRARRQGL